MAPANEGVGRSAGVQSYASRLIQWVAPAGAESKPGRAGHDFWKTNAAILPVMMVLFANAAQAADYWYVAGITNDVAGNMFFVDADTVKKTGNTRNFQMTQVPLGSEPEQVKDNYAITDEEINCKENTKRPLALSVYKATGELISKTTFSYQTHAVPTDSVDQQIERFVCSSNTGRAQAQEFVQTHDQDAYAFAHMLWQRSKAGH